MRKGVAVLALKVLIFKTLWKIRKPENSHFYTDKVFYGLVGQALVLRRATSKGPWKEIESSGAGWHPGKYYWTKILPSEFLQRSGGVRAAVHFLWSRFPGSWRQLVKKFVSRRTLIISFFIFTLIIVKIGISWLPAVHFHVPITLYLWNALN